MNIYATRISLHSKLVIVVTLLLLAASIVVAGANSATPAPPKFVAFINVGGQGYATTPKIQACTSASSCSGYLSGTTTRIVNSAAKVQDAGWFIELHRRQLKGNMKFAIPTGNGIFKVQTGYSEIENLNKGERVFNQTVEGAPTLTNFDIVAASGDKLKAIARASTVTVVDGVLNVDYVGIKNSPALAALAVEKLGDLPSTTTVPSTVPPVTSGWPDATNTGVKSGSVLTTYAGPMNITTDGFEIRNKLINGILTISARNVKIINSKTNEIVRAGYFPKDEGTLFEDFEMDGHDTSDDGIVGSGYTCRRCNVYNVSKGFSGSKFTIVDSYIHDLYGYGESHNETILGYGGDIDIVHNSLVGNFNSRSNLTPGVGGMSSILALYSGDGSGHWGPLNGVRVTNNRIESGNRKYGNDTPSFCLDGGGQHATNIVFKDNVFSRNPYNVRSDGSGGLCGWNSNIASLWSNPGNVESGSTETTFRTVL